jgi:hypothetical protein
MLKVSIIIINKAKITVRRMYRKLKKHNVVHIVTILSTKMEWRYKISHGSINFQRLVMLPTKNNNLDEMFRFIKTTFQLRRAAPSWDLDSKYSPDVTPRLYPPIFSLILLS